MTAYLDETGLEELWSKVQGLIGSNGSTSNSITVLYSNSSGSRGGQLD